VSDRRIATVLMLDVVGSTHIAADLGDARYRELSSRFVRIVRTALRRFGGREEDHAGDGFFATFPQPDGAIRCAAGICDDVRALGIEIRCGIHIGQTEQLGGKTQGIAVVIGARVMALAGAGEILVTSTTKELVAGSRFGFDDLSAHELKGVPGTWQVYAVTAVDGVGRARPLPAAEAAERRATIEPSGERRSFPAAVVVGVGVVIALAVATWTVIALTGERDRARSPERRPSVPPSGSVVQLDAETGRTLMTISATTRAWPGSQQPDAAHGMVVGQGGVWVARLPHFLVHVDPVNRNVRGRLTVEAALSFSLNVTEGADAIWVSTFSGLRRVNPATHEQRLAVDLRRGLEGLGTADVAFGEGHVWLGSGDRRFLLRLDPRTGRKRMLQDTDPVDQIAIGHGAVWTLDVLGSTVSRYEPDPVQDVATISLDGGVDALVAGEMGIWALSRSLGTLTRIDPLTNEPAQTVRVGPDPTVATAALGTIWVGDEDGRILRVDEETREISEFPLGADIRSIAFDDETDTVWVDVA
jgi:class 3 adenylate cyclase/streptogramin lyase